MAAPFLTHGNRVDRGYELGAASARDVDDSSFGGLRSAKAEEHRVRLFGITRHDCGSDSILRSECSRVAAATILLRSGADLGSGAIWRASSRSGLAVVICIMRWLRKSIKGIQKAARSCRSEGSTGNGMRDGWLMLLSRKDSK